MAVYNNLYVDIRLMNPVTKRFEATIAPGVCKLSNDRHWGVVPRPGSVALRPHTGRGPAVVDVHSRG